MSGVIAAPDEQVLGRTTVPACGGWLIRPWELLLGAITDPYLQTQVLADLARAAAERADLDWAGAAARMITDLGPRALVLADLARAAARAGDVDRAAVLAGRAEAAARAITDPARQAEVLAGLARAAIEAGDLDRAEVAARAITDPAWQAQILADIARKAEPRRARLLLARALTTGHWLASLDALTKVNPASVISIADEYLSAKT